MEHPCDLAKRIGSLLFDEKTSDMTFIVEGEYLPAHRAILIASCEYFRALLHGNMKESLQDEVVLKDAPLKGFKLLMKYIYTGQLGLKQLDTDTILEVLEIAHLYGLAELETTLCQSLQKSLSIDNVCSIFSKAHFLQLKELCAACKELMFSSPEAILGSETLCDLSEAALLELLSQDTFCAEEIEIFNAVVQWSARNPTHADISKVLGTIRLPLINTTDLVTTVNDSGLFSTQLLIDAIRTKKCHGAELKFRGFLRSEVNLASPDCGALRLTARDNENHITPRICPAYDSEAMPSYTSEFDFHLEAGLTIALKQPSIVNHISFQFCNRSFGCSYYIETSVNLVDWVRIVDHSQYTCRSFQKLYFESRVVRYIRLITIWDDSEEVVTKLSTFEVTHVTKPFKLIHGFYAPDENVASWDLGAAILRSKEDSDGLIREEKTDDPDKSNWTSHEIGNGSITIRLPQPYTVSSMRMLLRSDESQAYLYYIETCVSWGDWTRLVDHTDDLCRSWQNIVFEPRTVRYINIVGTASTVGKFFSCARFECPAPARGNLDGGQVGKNAVESVAADFS